jgi:hypothetical protein
MARRLLTGVETVENWSSLAGALTGALRFLGERAEPAWVMGVSGLAFRLALPVHAGTVAAPGAETAIDLERAAPLLRNLGRAVAIVRADPGTRDYARRREEVVRRVRRGIDRGIPAVVYDLHLPRFGLVTGYDDRAGAWIVSTMLSGQYGALLPLSRWPVPERPAPVIALLLGDRVRVDPRRAVREALAFAVRYAARGDPGDPTGAVHGPAAYARWREAFERGEDVSAAGNAVLVQVLQSARRDAAAFLRGDAARLLPAAAPALARAADAYWAEVLALSRMMTLFPYPTGGDPSGPAARLAAAGALREALAREQEALAALRAVVEDAV